MGADQRAAAEFVELLSNAASADLELRKAKQASPPEERAVLLVTTVDIGAGLSDKIEIRQGDDPTDAARAFCARHDLPPSIVGPLTEHILDNMSKAAAAALSGSADGKDTSPAPSTATDAPALPDQHSSRSSKVGTQKGGPFSFGGQLDDRLFDQLSAKLMPVAPEALAGKSNPYGANELLTSSTSSGLNKRNNSGGPDLMQYGHGGAVRKQHPQQRLGRQSKSAEQSPSVHQRLYVGALDRAQRLDQRRKMQAAEAVASQTNGRASMSWISTEMMRERTAGVFDNYGEMLYAEGLEASALLKRKAEADRAERAALELSGVTFHPEISALAKALYDGDADGSSASPAWARLSKGVQARTLERIEAMRQAAAAAEVAECTFKPRLNRTSVAMMAERGETLKALHIAHHDQLYQDAERRQNKMDELAQWHPDEVTFQPVVNKTQAAREYLRRSWDRLGTSGISPRMGLAASVDGPASSVRSSMATDGRPFVVDRLYASYEKRNAKLEETRAKLTGSIDPVTGRTLYQPEIGRGPRDQGARNKDGRPIGQYLYTVAQEMSARKEAALEAEKKAADEEAARGRACDVSQKMFERLRLKRFHQIFAYLDAQQTGSLDLCALVAASDAATAAVSVLDTAPPDAAAALAQRTDRIDNLDNDVHADVQLAAAIWAREHASPSATVTLSASDIAASADGSEMRAPPPLSLQQFIGVMEAALAARRGPRSYLVPSPGNRNVASPTFRPTINARSKEMAAKLRPPDIQLFELLHQNARATREKLDAMRKDAEESQLKGCTFAPRLNPPARSNGNAPPRSGSTSVRASTDTLALSPRGGLNAVNSRPAEQNASNAAILYGGDDTLPARSVLSPGAAATLLSPEAGLSEFAALEQELADMMTATQAAGQRLDQLEGQSSGAADGGNAVEAARSAAALRAIEEVLLHELVDPAKSGAVKDKQLSGTVSQVTSQELTPNSGNHKPLNSAGRRRSREGAAVVAPRSAAVASGMAAAGANGSGSLQQLAEELEGWDHNRL